MNTKLNPSALVEAICNLVEILEKKMKDINSLNESINNLKELITYFKDEHTESKKLRNVDYYPQFYNQVIHF